MEQESHPIELWKRFDEELEETYTHLKAILRQPNFEEAYSRHYRNLFRDLVRAIEEYFEDERD